MSRTRWWEWVVVAACAATFLGIVVAWSTSPGPQQGFRDTRDLRLMGWPR